MTRKQILHGIKYILVFWGSLIGIILGAYIALKILAAIAEFLGPDGVAWLGLILIFLVVSLGAFIDGVRSA